MGSSPYPQRKNYFNLPPTSFGAVGREYKRKRMNAKLYLREFLKTKIKTAFIFPLAQFEHRFGRLWGEHLADGEELTDEQARYDDFYQMVRKDILDNGNNQIRNMELELERFIVEWVGRKPHAPVGEETPLLPFKEKDEAQ